MQWICKIAILTTLLAGWFGGDTEPRRPIPVESQLFEAHTAAELVAEVRRHCHLNLPSSFESLPSSARLQMRTPAKQHSSRFGSWSVATDTHSHKTFSKSYGGHHSPQTAAIRVPWVFFTQLCRWII